MASNTIKIQGNILIVKCKNTLEDKCFALDKIVRVFKEYSQGNYWLKIETINSKIYTIFHSYRNGWHCDEQSIPCEFSETYNYIVAELSQ